MFGSITQLRLILFGVIGVALIGFVLGFIHHIRVVEDHKWELTEQKAVTTETERRLRQSQHDTLAQKEATNGLAKIVSDLIAHRNDPPPDSWLHESNRQGDAARAKGSSASGIPSTGTVAGNDTSVCSGGPELTDLWPRMQLLAVVGGILTEDYQRLIKLSDAEAVTVH